MDIRLEAAKTWSADKIRAAFQDRRISARDLNAQVALLAACGKPADADALFQKLEQENFGKAAASGSYFAILALNPKKYVPKVKEQACNEKLPFLQRYAILYAIRALHEAKLPALPEATLLDMMEVYLDQPDMADFPIESFRKWQRWEYTGRILAMYGMKAHNTAVTRNAILRYALQSPQPAAAKFVAQIRKMDPEWVEDVEDNLKEYSVPK